MTDDNDEKSELQTRSQEFAAAPLQPEAKALLGCLPHGSSHLSQPGKEYGISVTAELPYTHICGAGWEIGGVKGAYWERQVGIPSLPTILNPTMALVSLLNILITSKDNP